VTKEQGEELRRWAWEFLAAVETTLSAGKP